ncbi:glycosyltransferase [Luteimonas kalidii]|uniref:Glycosyltransferase n=1 Tax=Luteimonas kalidii TaxID=3042025 RepID=A0ABT6JYL8_9GAMM|nr:glycosyltransferase [Luteimonas kalidii]MDH5835572.1 glycosyltransferase [Luteimonas kalidii]
MSRPGVDADRIVVLFSTERPGPTTNPYLSQLYGALPAPLEQRYFSMREALWGDYDVLHLHWPEYLLRHPRRIGTWAKHACVLLLLVRLRARRTAVVRTLHNVQPHEDGGRVERWLLRGLDRATRRWIRINAATPPRVPATDTILHGHYRDWFAAMPRPSPEPGRLLHFGLIRPYKGVESLISAMERLQDPQVRLRICGRPSDARIRRDVEQACLRDPRISARLDYLDDATLAAEVGLSELVVLPYRQMHNSGTLLLALSLGRPVLAPRSPANAAIADEVGHGWVHLYEGELAPSVLADALARTRAGGRTSLPDLSRREWPAIGLAHLAAYRDALAATGARP